MINWSFPSFLKKKCQKTTCWHEHMPKKELKKINTFFVIYVLHSITTFLDLGLYKGFSTDATMTATLSIRDSKKQEWMPSSSRCFKLQLSWSFAQANSSHLESPNLTSNELGVSLDVSFFSPSTALLHAYSLSLKANTRMGGCVNIVKCLFMTSSTWWLGEKFRQTDF